MAKRPKCFPSVNLVFLSMTPESRNRRILVWTASNPDPKLISYWEFLHFAVFLFESARPLWHHQVRKRTEQLHASLIWIWSLYCSEADGCKHTSETTGRDNRSFNQQWTCSLFPRRSFKSSINRVSNWTFSFFCFSPSLSVLSVPSWITDLSGKNQLNGHGNHTAAHFTTQTLHDDYCCGIKCVFIILPKFPTLNLWVFNDSSTAVFQMRGCSFFFFFFFRWL